MNLTFLVPFFIGVIGNMGYHLAAKATPSGVPPFLALSVAYLVSFLLCAATYLITSHSLREDLFSLNGTCAVWGVTLVGVELGYILMYRAGWKISTASLVVNVTIALLLTAVGVLYYKDILLPRQFLGIALCLIGIFFLHT